MERFITPAGLMSNHRVSVSIMNKPSRATRIGLKCKSTTVAVKPNWKLTSSGQEISVSKISKAISVFLKSMTPVLMCQLTCSNGQSLTEKSKAKKGAYPIIGRSAKADLVMHSPADHQVMYRVILIVHY